MQLFYNLGIFFYGLTIRLASLFVPKAKLWVNGRKHVFERLKAAVANDNQVVWFHCASLGEFEQGRPLIEKVRSEHPSAKIVLTFFSPSGYEVRKNYTGVDYVSYLPLDTAANAKQWLEILNPKLVVFVKYEFWYHYLSQLEKRQVPTYIVSAIFRPDQHFFKKSGGWYRKVLSTFSHIFVQDEGSKALLAGIHVDKVSVSGDTRFDRVVAIAEAAEPVSGIETFIAGKTTLIVGSSWEPDEKLLLNYLQSQMASFKVIIAPHEIGQARLDGLKNAFGDTLVFFSKTNEAELQAAQVLVIDSIGLLSRLYAYADVAMIGGGFGVGIHNTLEAATFGLPIVIGPNYQRFKEAVDLVELEAIQPVTNQKAFDQALTAWIENEAVRKSAGEKAKAYVQAKQGATDQIYTHIKQHLPQQ